jgi:hypothetical protein
VAKGASRIGIGHIDRKYELHSEADVCSVLGPSRSRDDDTNATRTDRGQNRIRDNAIDGVEIQIPRASIGTANPPPP